MHLPAGLLAAAAVLLSPLAIHMLSRPYLFRYGIVGATVGVCCGLGSVYIHHWKQNTVTATYLSFGLSGTAIDYSKVAPIIYKHLPDEYIERGELELGEEGVTVQPYVFSQIGVLGMEGVRQMWTNTILPCAAKIRGGHTLKGSTLLAPSLEKGIVFCDIGSGVGNICMQILAETNCRKTVGVEVIPSRVRASREASRVAAELFPEVFGTKEIIWVEDNVTDCASRLCKERVNVIFTHSWMFDDALMGKLTEVIIAVPSVTCVITSRKLNDEILSGSPLKLSSLIHLAADWNDEAPFFVYTTVS